MGDAIRVELELHGVLSAWSSVGSRSAITVPSGSAVGKVLVDVGLPESARWAIVVDGVPGDWETRLVGPGPVTVAVFPRISGGTREGGRA